MMLKAFFLSQVAHAIGLPENVPGDILYSTDAGVTGMAPPSENILRRSADRHRIERKIVGRLLKGSNRGDPYQQAVEKSTWAKVAVVGLPTMALINVCVGLFRKLFSLNFLIVYASIGSFISGVFTLTTLIFALLHATGWFRVNAAIAVGAFITFVGIFVGIVISVRDLLVNIGISQDTTPADIKTASINLLEQIQARVTIALYAWALTGSVWAIATFLHIIRGAWIPAIRLLF